MSNPNSCLKYFKSLKSIVAMSISCRSIEVSGRREVSLSNSIATTFINTFNIITHSGWLSVFFTVISLTFRIALTGKDLSIDILSYED